MMKVHVKINGKYTEDDPAAPITRVNKLIAKAQTAGDERLLTLMLASYADEVLRRLLLQYLRDGSTTKSLIGEDNGMAALGSFFARTKVSYSLKLISRQQMQDLDCLRELRNKFAHRWEDLGLDDPALAVHVDGLHPVRFAKYSGRQASRRETLTLVICAVLVELETALHFLSQQGRDLLPERHFEFDGTQKQDG